MYSSVEDGGMCQIYTYGIHSENLTEKYKLHAKCDSHGDMDNLLVDISSTNLTPMIMKQHLCNRTVYMPRNDAEDIAFINN